MDIKLSANDLSLLIPDFNPAFASLYTVKKNLSCFRFRSFNVFFFKAKLFYNYGRPVRTPYVRPEQIAFFVNLGMLEL